VRLLSIACVKLQVLALLRRTPHTSWQAKQPRASLASIFLSTRCLHVSPLLAASLASSSILPVRSHTLALSAETLDVSWRSGIITASWLHNRVGRAAPSATQKCRRHRHEQRREIVNSEEVRGLSATMSLCKLSNAATGLLRSCIEGCACERLVTSSK
jgi:hypothetical protein